MRVAINEVTQGGILPYRAIVYDGEGEAISRRYMITEADTESETYKAWVDAGGDRLAIWGRTSASPRADRIETFHCPGLRIEEEAS